MAPGQSRVVNRNRRGRSCSTVAKNEKTNGKKNNNNNNNNNNEKEKQIQIQIIDT